MVTANVLNQDLEVPARLAAAVRRFELVAVELAGDDIDARRPEARYLMIAARAFAARFTSLRSPAELAVDLHRAADAFADAVRQADDQ
jgi:hypothetical protein